LGSYPGQAIAWGRAAPKRRSKLTCPRAFAGQETAQVLIIFGCNKTPSWSGALLSAGIISPIHVDHISLDVVFQLATVFERRHRKLLPASRLACGRKYSRSAPKPSGWSGECRFAWPLLPATALSLCAEKAARLRRDSGAFLVFDPFPEG